MAGFVLAKTNKKKILVLTRLHVSKLNSPEVLQKTITRNEKRRKNGCACGGLACFGMIVKIIKA